MLHVHLVYTTAWHPQSDGQSERTNQQVEIALRHFVASLPNQHDWEEGLPPIQAALNSASNASTGHSPHMLLFGMSLRQPWQMHRQAFDHDRSFAVRHDARESLAFASMSMKKYYDAKHKPIFFAPGDFVYLKLGDSYDIAANERLAPKVAQRYVGRFKVLERIGKLAYRLDFPTWWQRHPVVSVAHLEKCPQNKDDWDRQDDTVHEPTDDERFPDEERFEVEEILDKRTRKVGRPRRDGSRAERVEYLIRWKGQSAREDKWIPATDAEGPEELIAKFESSRQK